MKQVDVEAIVDHLDSDFRKALAATIREVLPTAEFDERQVLRVFKRMIRRKTGWEFVPDQAVKD